MLAVVDVNGLNPNCSGVAGLAVATVQQCCSSIENNKSSLWVRKMLAEPSQTIWKSGQKLLV